MPKRFLFSFFFFFFFFCLETKEAKVQGGLSGCGNFKDPAAAAATQAARLAGSTPGLAFLLPGQRGLEIAAHPERRRGTKTDGEW
ncbi:hypothetical protein [Flavobacterium sp.]|uniref:hypothetical protein n=1 Tax=Flavobacterium sp. TaxID=239 RepID=UPI0039E6C12E